MMDGFRNRGCTYFQLVDTKGEKNYFFLRNERLVMSWVNELKSSKSFYCWLKNISEIGYKSNQKYARKYNLINDSIVNIKLKTTTINDKESLLKKYASSMGSTDGSSGKEKLSPVSSNASTEENKQWLFSPDKNKRLRGSQSPEARTPLKKFETSTLEEDTDIGYKSFKILDILGQGTFGKVFRVEKVDNGKIYAMKVLK